ncbi:MAG: hypothetical protein ACKVOB_02655 [Sphingomonas sp.]
MATVTMSSVWDRTTDFLQESAGKYLPLALLLIAVPLALGGIVASVANTMTGGTDRGLRLVIIGLSLVSLWGQLGIAALVTGVAGQTGDAGKQGLARLPKVIVVFVLFGLGFVLLLVPPIIALLLTGTDLAMLGSNDPVLVQLAIRAVQPGYAWFIVLYSLAAMVVMIWAAIRLALLLPIVAAENLMLGAFRRSFALTKGLTLKIFGVLLLLIVVSGVAQLAAKAVFGTVFALVGMGTDPLAVGSLIATVLVAMVSAAFAVLSSVFSSNLLVAVRDNAPVDAPGA